MQNLRLFPFRSLLLLWHQRLPRPLPLLLLIDRMTEYRAQMISLAPRLPEVAERLSQRLIAPAYDNRYWVLEVRDLASQLVGIYEETLALTPPPSLEAVHASFVLGMKHYAEAGSLLSDGLASAESLSLHRRNRPVND